MRNRNLFSIGWLGILLIMGTVSLKASDLKLPVIIAHRGASGVAPENTAAAIRKALEMGARVIEFDVRGTADGGLVLFHDDKLERVAGREGSIETISLKEATTLEVGKWFGNGSFAGEKVMELSEAIQMSREGGAIPLIERKTGDAAAYAKVIRSLGAETEVIVQSFDWKFLKAFRASLPQTPIGALGSKEVDGDRVTQLTDLKPDWVGWKHSDLSPSLVEIFHGLEFRVASWTVNDPEVTSRLLGWGVNGIITDYPDKMLPLIER